MCLDLCPCSEPQFKKAIHVCSLKSAARESNVIPQKAKFQLDIIVVTHLQVAVTATYKHFYKRWLTRTHHAYALWLSGCTLPCMCIYVCLRKVLLLVLVTYYGAQLCWVLSIATAILCVCPSVRPSITRVSKWMNVRRCRLHCLVSSFWPYKVHRHIIQKGCTGQH